LREEGAACDLRHLLRLPEREIAHEADLPHQLGGRRRALLEPQLLITGAGLPGIPGNLKVAVDQATNQIYLIYQDYHDGNGGVRVLRVADAGDHFVVQGRTTVKTDPADQFFPFVSVAPNGRVDVCYQDKGYLPGNSLIFTTSGFSTDHALSFTNQQVTTVAPTTRSTRSSSATAFPEATATRRRSSSRT